MDFIILQGHVLVGILDNVGICTEAPQGAEAHRHYLNMAVGTYTMKVGYGTEWYGEIDLFGPGGQYSQLLNGSDPNFTLKGGYSYTLTLGGVADGNVDSRNLGGAGGM